jgi:hypothetical protein
MQIGPPFSRRRSPNRPSPYSIEAIASSRESMKNSRNQPRDGSARCVNTIALSGGGIAESVVLSPMRWPSPTRVPQGEGRSPSLSHSVHQIDRNAWPCRIRAPGRPAPGWQAPGWTIKCSNAQC